MQENVFPDGHYSLHRAKNTKSRKLCESLPQYY